MALSFALLGVHSFASAQESDPHLEARTLYERATRAFDARDYASAARDFARADALVPSSAALEAALDAAALANDAVLAIQLVDRAQRGGLDARAKSAADRARSSFASKVGRIVLPCDERTACTATLDDAPVERPSAPLVVAPGRHAIHLVRADVAADYPVDVPAGHTLVLAEPRAGAPGLVATSRDSASGPKAPRTEERTSTFGKFMTWTAGGLTVLAGAATVISYGDLRVKRTDFENGRCGGEANSLLPASDCDARADRGRNAELRTALLGGATGAFALTTAAFLLFRPWKTTVAVDAGADRAALLVRGRWP